MNCKLPTLILLSLMVIGTPSFGQLMGGYIQYEYNGADPITQTFSYYMSIFRYDNYSNNVVAIRFFDAGTGLPVKNLSSDPADPEDINQIPRFKGQSVANRFSSCLGSSNLNNTYNIGRRYADVRLPINDSGYYITVTGLGRSKDLVNIYDPLNTGVLFISKIPGMGNGLGHFQNWTPKMVFNDTVTVCRNSYFSYQVTATDHDGDSLAYRLGDALTHNFDSLHYPPEIPVAYKGLYTGKEPMGPGVTFDTATHILSGTVPDQPGGYLIAIYIEEWRNGYLLNTTKKEMQIKVVSCPYVKPLLKPQYSHCNIYTFTFKNEPTCPDITKYKWDFGDTTTLADTSIMAVPTYTYPGKGPYQLKLTISNNNGFIDSATSLVQVYDSVVVKISPDTAVCKTDAIQLNPTSNADSFFWRESGNSNTLNSYTIKNPIANPGADTTFYYVTGRLDGCVDSARIALYASPYPIAKSIPDTVLCFGQKTTLASTVKAAFYNWQPTDGLFNGTSTSPIAYPNTSMVYILSARDTFYCPKTVRDTVKIRVIPNFTIDAGKDQWVVAGQHYQLNATPVGNAATVTYNWQPSQYLDLNNIPNPYATINDASAGSVVFKVKATTVTGGCSATGQVMLKVFGSGADIIVPSSFTPNNDGKNDVLKPILVGINTLLFFAIYNRWGQIIFTTSQAGKGWDGNINGLQQPTGTYVFTVQGIDHKGKKLVKQGTVLLLR